MFTRQVGQGVSYLQIPKFKKWGITAIFSTRKGGFSRGSYTSLNLAFHTGDNPQTVIKNRQQLGKALDLDYREFVAGEQVHGNRIYRVSREDRGRGALTPGTAIPGVDALITGDRRVPLISFYADCVPLFLVDPVCGVVGLAHAGWKGTLSGIGSLTIREMARTYGSNPRNCRAAIGPAIGPSNYQVDRELVVRFRDKFNSRVSFIEETGDGQYFLDLKEANRLDLCRAGIPSGQIFVSGLCTYDNPQLFYSHRRDGPRTGRMLSLIIF